MPGPQGNRFDRTFSAVGGFAAKAKHGDEDESFFRTVVLTLEFPGELLICPV